jgi:tRNA dimethylallyltransferase
MNNNTMPYNAVMLLGPTASGKTPLAVRIADYLKGEIISADSRQVYRGLDIGSGKDLHEYTKNGRTIPYHLIDIADLSAEYSVFDFQRDAYRAFENITAQKKIPVIAGGTGMYLDCLIRGYDFVEVPVNEQLRNSLHGKPIEELAFMLSQLKDTALHNTTDVTERHRLIRAIEIETFTQSGQGQALRAEQKRPDIHALVLGSFFPRVELRKRISVRLCERFEQGMVSEVERLHASGVSWERLVRLGLEYKYIALFLQGKIANEFDLFTILNAAIAKFAKRQDTWFRGMERKGVTIFHLPYDIPFAADTSAASTFSSGTLTDARFAAALDIIREHAPHFVSA